MEILNPITTISYAFHYLIVSGVFVGAILLFVFGFKSAEEPNFGKLKSDSKLVSKKKKGKEKKIVNGNTTPKENSTPKTKNNTIDGKKEKNISLKASKNSKKDEKKKEIENLEYNADFSDDEVNWEQAQASLLYKKNWKGQNIHAVVKGNENQLSVERNNVKNARKDDKQKSNKTKKRLPKAEKTKDDEGEWQQARTKRRAHQGIDYLITES